MNIGDIEQYSKNLNRKIFFDYELKKTNWFNIGGKAKIYFKPETLQELIEFLKLYNNRGKIFVICTRIYWFCFSKKNSNIPEIFWRFSYLAMGRGY